MTHPLKTIEGGTQPRDSSGAKAPQWPNFSGTSQLVGTSQSGRVTVYVDPTLGAPGLQNAQALLNDADRVANANDQIFGTQGGDVSIVYGFPDANGNPITDGTGGADHGGCDYTSGAAIEVCASFGNAARVSALFEAELSECSMGGNLCGCNTGEALSRWCAAVVGNNALSDFATAPTWFQDGTPDYVDQTDPTDQNADSTGCGMAFLSWLMHQGYALGTIAPAMVALGDQGTFAQLYANLTTQPASNAWPSFQSAFGALTNGVTSDDPFGGVAQSAQMAHMAIAPWAVEIAGKVFASILADISAGKTEHQIVAGVRAAMLASRHGGRTLSGAPVCPSHSRRLRPPSRP